MSREESPNSSGIFKKKTAFSFYEQPAMYTLSIKGDGEGEYKKRHSKCKLKKVLLDLLLETQTIIARASSSSVKLL